MASSKNIPNLRLQFKNHTIFKSKMVKISTLFMTKTAEKVILQSKCCKSKVNVFKVNVAFLLFYSQINISSMAFANFIIITFSV